MRTAEDTAEADHGDGLPRSVYRANVERQRAEAITRRRKTQLRRATGFSRRRSLRRSR